MTTPQYQQEFNKQLAEQLHSVRKQQPNHIPVYSMKYKNASKYLIQDLKQPLALFPKKFTLKTIYDIIQKQSQTYCKEKLSKTDAKIIKEGENFKIPKFNLYTIEIINSNQEKKDKNEKQKKENYNKKDKPVGKFVKLSLQMTFQQAFNKYGRENVLTLVYTDAQQVRLQYTKTQRRVQKWVQRLLIFILVLIVIPYLIRDSQKYEDVRLTENHNTSEKYYQANVNSERIDLDIDTIDYDNQHSSINIPIQRTETYDDELI